MDELSLPWLIIGALGILVYLLVLAGVVPLRLPKPGRPVPAPPSERGDSAPEQSAEAVVTDHPGPTRFRVFVATAMLVGLTATAAQWLTTYTFDVTPMFTGRTTSSGGLLALIAAGHLTATARTWPQFWGKIWPWLGVTAVGSIAVMTVVITGSSQDSQAATVREPAVTTAASNAPHEADEIEPGPTPLPMPAHGHMQWLEGQDHSVLWGLENDFVGELTVSVPAGAETYYVKLRRLHKYEPTGTDVLGVTIAPGQTVTFDVPLSWTVSSTDPGQPDSGVIDTCKYFPAEPPEDCAYAAERTDYELLYASGTQWFGHDLLFGPDGRYARADEILDFEQWGGWEVELIMQPGGNLATDGVAYEDF